MSAPIAESRQGRPDPQGPASPAPAWGTGRSGLVLALLMLAVAVYLTVGIVTMTVPEEAEPPGPKFFPVVLDVACYLLAGLLVLHYARTPEQPADTEGVEQVEDEEHASFTDWRALLLTMAAFLLFAALLDPVGWIISAALMFWIIAWAMGSRTPLRDVAIALVVSCGVQVAFSLGLGLALPAGVLEGVL